MPTVPPDALVVSDQAKPVPLPPAAVNATVPSGGTAGAFGEMVTPAVTETFARPVLPRASVTRTVSVTPPVDPAVYAPVVAMMVPPEGLVASDQTNPVPLPPTAANDREPRGGTV